MATKLSLLKLTRVALQRSGVDCHTKGSGIPWRKPVLMIFKTLLVGATLIYGRACDPLIGKLQSPVTETPSRLQVIATPVQKRVSLC